MVALGLVVLERHRRKARFARMLCDFDGTVLIPPATVPHNWPELDFGLKPPAKKRGKQ